MGAESGSTVSERFGNSEGRPRGKSVPVEELKYTKARGEPGRIQGCLDPVVISRWVEV